MTQKPTKGECTDGKDHELAYLRSVPGYDVYECKKCGKFIKKAV